MMLRRSLFLVALLCPSAVAFAQERVTIGTAPRPGQVLHTHTTMETKTDMDAPSDGPPMPFAMPALAMTMTMDGTMQVSAPDEHGHYTAHMIIDTFTMDMTMNGKPVPSPVAIPDFVGQECLFTYDEHGTMVETKLPGNKTISDAVEKMLTNLAGLTAPVEIAVGETVTRPTSLAMPLPTPGAAGGSMTIQGEMKMTLDSLEAAGANRIAHLTTAITSAVSGGNADASGFTLQQNGTGTMDVNVDRGFVMTVTQHSTADISVPLGAAGPSTPVVHSRAVMTMTSTTAAK
jgi:hypothetical protein